jgi:hypothetical protein
MVLPSYEKREALALEAGGAIWIHGVRRRG